MDTATNRNNRRNRKARSARGGNRRNKGHRSGQTMRDNAVFGSVTSVVYPRDVIGFPDRLVTTLKYSEQYTQTGSSSPTAQKMNCNSPFDPNGTGIGHQPSFYDAYQVAYGRYYVEEFAMEVEFVNNSSTVPVYCCLAYSDTDISGATLETMVEGKYAKLKTLAPLTAGKGTFKMSLPWMKSSKLMGSFNGESDDNMYSITTANPADIAWGMIKLQSVDGTTSVNVTFRVVLLQRIAFKDLTPTQSSLLKYPIPTVAARLDDDSDEEGPSTPKAQDKVKARQPSAPMERRR